MKCRECTDYAKCAKESNLKIKRKSCKKAKTEYVMTNADRIRAMSDEELAELIVKHNPMYAWNKQVREIYFSFDDHRKDNPKRAWMEWLKQPTKGE